jgi:hypothetical protein
MTRPDLARLLAALALAPALAACSGEAAITGVSPAEGSARGGETVTIAGHGFGASPTVRVGGKPAVVKSSSGTAIEVVTPREIAGAVDVEVTASGKTTHLPRGFTYLALPFSFVDAAWSRLPALAVDGGGAVIADGDGDGDGDVFQAARGEGVWVYTNDGKGSLGDPRLLHVGDAGAPADVHAVVGGDFDGDGKIDLFVGTTGATASRLLRGDGKLGFTAFKKALPALFGTEQSAVAVDLDGDGDLDLVTVGAASAVDGAPGVVILSNDGKGVFTDVTAKHLVGGTFNASGVAVGDVDGDGHPDLFFAADQEPCRLYLNDGHGVLQRAAPDAIPYDPTPGAGVPALGDLDGDGSLDVYLPSAGQDRVLVNDGKGHFTDDTDILLGPEAGAGRSAVLADLDLDGHLDVAVVDRPGGLRLYRNDGTGRLFDYSAEIAGADGQLLNAGVAIGDLDGDGDLDLFVSRADLSRAALLLSWSPLAPADRDGDGVPDLADNCPEVPNPDQENLDSLPFRCASATQCQTETGCELHALGTSAYLLCKAAMATWADASAACVARGGHLVTIAGAEENAFLVGLGVADAWIGYTDAAMEGTFVWVSGHSTYVNWAMSQPDNAGGTENCASITADGTWNDLPCDATRSFVCQDLRSRAPDPGDACDACPTRYDPGSTPVEADAGTCGGADAGTP